MLRVSLGVAFALVLAGPASAQHAAEPLLKRVGALPGELVKAGRTDAEMVDALFFITLGRLPKDDEKGPAVKFVAAAKDRAAAGRDVAWALVNTKEFLKLHGLDGNVVEAQKFIAKFIAEWGKEEKKEAKKEEGKDGKR